MWRNLFYDKYAGDINGKGDHHYNNSITSKISIDDLNDGSYNIYTDKDALEYYNKKFPQYFSLPDCVYQTDFFKLLVYTQNVKSIETIYVVISVNTSLLEDKIKKEEKIEHMDFLKQLFRYHMAYTETTKFIINSYFYNSDSHDKKINQNIEYIVENATKAVDYSLDNKIDNLDEISVKLHDYLTNNQLL